MYFLYLAYCELAFSWLALLFLLSFTISYFISNIIHELAHYAFFKHYGLPIVELSFGVFRIIFTDGRGRLLWTLDRPYDALCSCKGLRGISRRKRTVCLLAGGVINFVTAVILTVLYFYVSAQQIKLLLLVQITACIANTGINIINPYSTDRKLLRQLNNQDFN